MPDVDMKRVREYSEAADPVPPVLLAWLDSLDETTRKVVIELRTKHRQDEEREAADRKMGERYMFDPDPLAPELVAWLPGQPPEIQDQLRTLRADFQRRSADAARLSAEVAAKIAERPEEARHQAGADAFSDKPKIVGGMAALVLLGFVVLKSCPSAEDKARWDARSKRETIERRADQMTLDKCIRDGNTKQWCEDRLEVLHRTGQ